MNLPNDPFILLSVVNTKLRDCYSSLDSMCEDLDIDKQELVKTLGNAGFRYDISNNTFKE